MTDQINFFKEGVTFRLQNAEKLKKWIAGVVLKEHKTLADINFVFCNDPYLKKMNKKYLKHDYNTDVITFDNSDGGGVVAGDIFISIDRIKQNAKQYSTTFNDELHRVMVHGVLHLLGYDDTNEELKAEIRKMEDLYLKLRSL